MLLFLELLKQIIEALGLLTHVFLGPESQILMRHARLYVQREVCALQVRPQWHLVLYATLVLLSEIVIAFKRLAFQR